MTVSEYHLGKQKYLTTMRRYLNGLIQVGFLGAAIVFIARVLLEHWQDVKVLELQPQAWVYGTVALGVAILAQVIESLVWGWLLADMQQSVPTWWSMITFIKYVPAKYIPGNIWHMYGRVIAAQRQGLSLEPTTLSVMLEPLFCHCWGFGLGLAATHSPGSRDPGSVPNSFGGSSPSVELSMASVQRTTG